MVLSHYGTKATMVMLIARVIDAVYENEKQLYSYYMHLGID